MKGWWLAALFCAVLGGTAAAQSSSAPSDEPVVPRSEQLDALFADLANATEIEAEAIEKQIYAIWYDAGSASMNLLFERARRAMTGGNAGAALQHLNDLVGLAPEFAEGWNLRATLYYYLGEHQKSLNDIQATLEREPRHFGALAGRGLVFYALGDEGKARLACLAALALHPQLSGPRQMLQQLDEGQGQGKKI